MRVCVTVCVFLFSFSSNSVRECVVFVCVFFRAHIRSTRLCFLFVRSFDFSIVIISYVLFWVPTTQCTSHLLLLFWYLRCRSLVSDGNIFHYFIRVLFHRGSIYFFYSFLPNFSAAISGSLTKNVSLVLFWAATKSKGKPLEPFGKSVS